MKRRLCSWSWLVVLIVLHQTGNIHSENDFTATTNGQTQTTAIAEPPSTTVNDPTTSQSSTSSVTIGATDAASSTAIAASTSDADPSTSGAPSVVSTGATNGASTAGATPERPTTGGSDGDATVRSSVVAMSTEPTVPEVGSTTSDTVDPGVKDDGSKQADMQFGIGIALAFLFIIGLSGGLFYFIVRKQNQNYARLDEELLVNYNSHHADNVSQASSDGSEMRDVGGDLELDMDPVGTELQGRNLQTF